MTKIAERTKRVQETIAAACARSGREPEDVRLIIVTKSADIEQIIATANRVEPVLTDIVIRCIEQMGH